MDSPIFLLFAAAYLALLVWGVRLAARHGWATPANLPLLVVAALVYDNAVLGLGSTLGHGPLLEGLNHGRYWIHAATTPTLVAWALHTLRRAGFTWAQSRAYQVLSIGAALALTVVEYFLEVQGLHLVPETEYGVAAYANAEPPTGPPLMVLIVAGVLVVAGALVWWKLKWPWLFVGAVVMTIGSGVQMPLPSGAITNAFELALMVSILATKAFQDRNDASAPISPPGRRARG